MKFSRGEAVRVILCDCCKRQIRDTEKTYSMKITSGNTLEMNIVDICTDCYNNIKQIVNKLSSWRKNNGSLHDEVQRNIQSSCRD